MTEAGHQTPDTVVPLHTSAKALTRPSFGTLPARGRVSGGRSVVWPTRQYYRRSSPLLHIPLVQHPVRLAAVEGLQGPVAEALFAAYFEQGLDIGDRAVLADIGERSGLDRTRVETVLAGEDLVAEVEGEIRSAQEMGVQGVPFFIIAGRYAVSGAEAAETLAGAMDKAAEEIAAA